MPNFKYTIDGAEGTIEAQDKADADMMIREQIDIKLEEVNEDDPREDR